LRQSASMPLLGRHFLLFAAAASCAAIVACASRPEESPDYVAVDNDITSGKGGKDDDDDNNGKPRVGADETAGQTEPAVTESVTPAPSDWTTAPADPGDAGTAADAGDAAPPPKAAPSIVTKSQSCTSTYGSHKSVSKMTWTVEGTKLTIKSLVVTVTNSYRRNLNDVDVYVRPPGGSESLAFNSGDILPSGKAITVPYKATTVVKSGHKVRILTNFDQEGGDPYASCTVTILP
jgi:hypothetical protein